ncbi:MAG: glycosyltransferase family 2 protein [Lachnospiraceae bacterium]|nr:glycosyltransferase family 2 protein [Lachnospiraceae bacterium]
MGPEVLLSAMFLEDENYIDTLNIHTDCVVINQCDEEEEREIFRDTPKGRMRISYVMTRERGLSKSRNMAISKALGPVCILCDNDVEYVKDYDRIVNDAFTDHPDADVLVFFVKRPERNVPVFGSARKMGYLSVLKIFSPEVAFRKEKIKDLEFNELFGAGARFFMGEENLFLYECLKRHLKIIYIPEMIASVRQTQSTWFKGYDKEFFVSRGANYAAMSKRFSSLLIFQYAFRKRGLYKDNMTVREALREMFEGRRQYFAIAGERRKRSG